MAFDLLCNTRKGSISTVDPEYFSHHNKNYDPYISVTTGSEVDTLHFISSISPIYNNLSIENFTQPHSISFGDTSNLFSLSEEESITFEVSFDKRTSFSMSIEGIWSDSVNYFSQSPASNFQVHQSDSLIFELNSSQYTLDSGVYKITFIKDKNNWDFINVRTILTEILPNKLYHKHWLKTDSLDISLDELKYQTPEPQWVYVGDTLKGDFSQYRGLVSEPQTIQ